MSNELDDSGDVTLISTDEAKEVLKQHFPEYLTGYCLCGMPIGTYGAWIDHVVEEIKATKRPDGQDESGGTDDSNV
jgi:hypothetical protein